MSETHHWHKSTWQFWAFTLGVFASFASIYRMLCKPYRSFSSNHASSTFPGNPKGLSVYLGLCSPAQAIFRAVVTQTLPCTLLSIHCGSRLLEPVASGHRASPAIDQASQCAHYVGTIFRLHLGANSFKRCCGGWNSFCPDWRKWFFDRFFDRENDWWECWTDSIGSSKWLFQRTANGIPSSIGMHHKRLHGVGPFCYSQQGSAQEIGINCSRLCIWHW